VALVNLGEGFSLGRSSAAPSSSSKAASDNGKAAAPAASAIPSWVPLTWKVPIVPLKHYAYQTALFFSMSYLNNFAFKFNISQPLHMVFRSANLVTTFTMGYLFFGRR
jgi:hypothetical protein